MHDWEVVWYYAWAILTYLSCVALVPLGLGLWGVNRTFPPLALMSRLLCSNAFLQWYAKSQGYSRACVWLLGFMSVLISVFGCHVCVRDRVACIGMQNGGSIRALVRTFVVPIPARCILISSAIFQRIAMSI